jgi:hypothetical protein
MKTFVIRAWAADDPTGVPPLELLELVAPAAAGSGPVLAPIATHPVGVVPDTAFQHDGKSADLCGALARNHLLDGALVAAAGRALYARLALGAVGQKLKDIPAGSRVLLDLRSPALERLPWEVIRRDELSLFLSTEQPWSRGTAEEPAIPAPLSAVDMSPTLRVLVVVGSKRDDPTVQGDAELRGIEDELHRCTNHMLVQVLVRPRAEEITRTFAELRPHAFHFIGHGAIVAGRPVLRVHSDALGESESWDPDRFRVALQGGAVPRLVVLNACNTATPGRSWDLAEAFIRAGVNAVVATQAEIVGSAASLFSRRLFQRLAAGDPVDVAVTAARNHVAGDGTQVERPNWPVPRLVVQGNPDDLLPRARRSSTPRPAVRAPDDFVGRLSQRKQAWDILCPIRGAGHRLVVLEGPQGSGKTALLRILGETWIRAWDRAAVYVDLGGPRSSNLDVLLERMIQSFTAARLSPAPLQTIAKDLPSDTLCATIRATLESCAPEGKLLLVLLDGLETWQPNVAARDVLRQLCAPYADMEVESRVRLAVAQPANLARGITGRCTASGRSSRRRWRSHAASRGPTRPVPRSRASPRLGAQSTSST